LLLIEKSEGFLRNGHSALGFALKFLFLDFGFKLSDGCCFLLIFGVRVGTSMFFCISFKPIDGKIDRIGRPFLDNIIDQRFDEDVHFRSDVVLDF